MFEKSVYTCEEKLRKAIADSVDFSNDPKNILVKKIGNRSTTILSEYRSASEGKEEYTKKYAAALLEKDKDKLKALYEEGIRNSFAKYGFDATEYINGETTQIDYEDPHNPANNIAAVNIGKKKQCEANFLFCPIYGFK